MELTFEEYKAKMDAYRESNGEYSLNTHIFSTGRENAINEKVPIFKIIEGIPVIVKHHDQEQVTLVNMEDGSELDVSMETYKEHCANIFQLDEGLMIRNPDRWEREKSLFDRGMKACGF